MNVSTKIVFPNDQEEDVVVKLVLFVGLYCGRDDLWIPKRRLYQRKRLKCGSQESQGGGGSRSYTNCKEQNILLANSRPEGGGSGGYNPHDVFSPQSSCLSRP